MPAPIRRHGLAAARHIAVDLTPQAIEALASRVAQLLRNQPVAETRRPPAPQWMTVKELAHHLKLNPAWVYEHAEGLGAIRTGSGPKARIRFDLHTATEALKQNQRQTTPPAAVPPRRKPPRPAPYPTDTPLLQIRDPYTRSVRGCLRRTRPRARLAVSWWHARPQARSRPNPRATGRSASGCASAPTANARPCACTSAAAATAAVRAAGTNAQPPSSSRTSSRA